MSTDRLAREKYGKTLIRSLLYQAMRNPPDDWPEWVIQPNEEYDIYKIAYKAYGTVKLWWVISVCAKLDDPLDRIPAGVTFRYPPIAWIHQKLKDPGRTITEY